MNRTLAQAAALLCAIGATVIAMSMPEARPGRRPSARGVVVPALPRPWHMPAARPTTIDYALPAQADAWVRHPILGDPSFDSFVRRPGNPIVRGRDPFKWPVNVSLFEDPVSGHWYAYVGLYLEGYAFGPGLPLTHCHIFRSEDRGATWTDIGPAFREKGFRFDGDAHGSDLAVDAQVVYHDGLYHMAYDWTSDNTTWANASAPSDGSDSGCAYAWAEKPEGPWHRNSRPILRTTEIQRLNGKSSRYCRVYACSLIRRKDDWLVLTDLDSGAHFAWGQVAMTARDPRGPWSKPVMIAGLEGDTYYPSPVEAFPVFVHDGYVYDPRTSVGRNRNFQLVMRAPIEEAHKPEAWSIYQHGSFWHSEWAPNEGLGLWGQAVSVWIDPSGRMDALFPTRYREDGTGAINAAHRQWSKPFRVRGFTLSAHAGRTMTLTRAAYGDFDLEADLVLKGGAARIAWGYGAPLGAEGRADGSPNPLTWTRHAGLELTPAGWRVLSAGEEGDARVVAEGKLATGDARRLRVTCRGEAVTVSIDGARVWQGALAHEPGPLALLLEPYTNLVVDRFRVTGTPAPATHTWLYSEAISGAGVAEGSYTREKGPAWRFGAGAVCRTPRERVKWNFRGRSFRLWLPRGPLYGRATVLLDGHPIDEIDLRADRDEPSRIFLQRKGLADGFHALVLKGDEHPMPVDCLDTVQ